MTNFRTILSIFSAILFFGFSTPAVAQVTGAFSFTYSFGNETFIQLYLPKIQIDIDLNEHIYIGVSTSLGSNGGNGSGSWGHTGLLVGYRIPDYFIETSLSYSSWVFDNGYVKRISVNPKIGINFSGFYSKAGPSFNVVEWTSGTSMENLYWYAGKLPDSDLRLPNFEIGYIGR